MPEEFDPYRKWLGIAPHEQPVHHYRLLGIAPFEDDPDVILNAADRQMSHIRTFQSGKNGPLSQKILNELAAAKMVLLDPARKSVYDNQLQDRLYADEGPLPPDMPRPPEMPPAPMPPVSAAPPAYPPATPPPPAPQGVSLPPRSPSPAPIPGQVPMGQAVAPTGVPLGQAVGAGSPSTTQVPKIGASRGTSARARVRAKRSQNIVPMVLGLIAVGAMLVGLLVFVVSQGSLPEDEPLHKTKTNIAANDTKTKLPPSMPEKKKTADTPDKTKSPDKTPADKLPAGKTPTDKPADPSLLPKTEVDLSKPLEEMSPEDRFQLAMERAREHLGRRDAEKAKRDLDDADFSEVDAELKREAKRLRTLYQHYNAFWDGVREGIYKRMALGDVYTYRGEELELIEREGELVKFKHNRLEGEEQINKLPAAVAVMFARRGLDTEKPQNLVVIGTFWALDGKSGKQKQHEKAKELWVEAAELGEKDEALANELKLDEAFVTSITPKAASKDDDIPAIPKLKPPMTEGEPMATNEPPSGSQAPIPTTKELAPAKERFQIRYADPLANAKGKPEAIEILLGILTSDAEKEKDPALKYLIYEQACELAIEIAKADSIVQLTDAMATHWEIDALKQQQTMLTRAKPVTSTSQESMLAECEKLLTTAEAADRLDMALAFSKLALKAGEKIKGQDLKPLQMKARELDAALDAADKARLATAALAKDPNDVQAHLNLGRYLCFYKSDWANGLPHLAQCTVGDEKTLATDDLAAPDDAAMQAQLAERWYQLGKRKAGVSRTACYQRANEWLNKALPQLSGDDKAKAEKLQGELMKELMPAMA